ncbi:MAG TPA: cation-efflux pump [Rhodocyclaceae bacterium]|nr:MAG: cation-efflux pump [Betaproteobacteria bacterium CG2_30_68_42]PIV72545.1 MAG: cation-efflux pump [Rhodocyclales bacterium CG17_big_fil_post_rev_8_21_14_2_50_68_7]PIX75542.1 MAG: cation-efflux pump [Rhodocyclales bacterium CG_4_10_14_3_um_filter_68_10]PJA58884.1 MAG: cation-efflux pump [Rhodocyclales bacterium CG_4_9_14_3_um_filter_68_10]HCX34872.1 cation-efflux pump [Rhodocyclaceae bacterium]
MNEDSLQKYAWLSIAAALATIALKGIAWQLTQSVGMLSDALESLVNLAAAIMALSMLAIAERPADEEHAFGHSKAEYFASAFEGLMILAAAVAIGAAAIERFLHPRPIERFGLGLAVSIAASAINFAVARVLLAAGQRYGSITLEADARHLMTDVWTSAGVLAALGAVTVTGWNRLDPIIALAVAANIVRTGIELLRRSGSGLMDAGLPEADQRALAGVLQSWHAQGIVFHALRSRLAGRRAFVTMHVLVPGAWSVAQAHEVCERIEADVRSALPHASVFTHIEPREDPASWHDVELDRR